MEAQENDERTFGSYFQNIGCTDPFKDKEECMKVMDAAGQEPEPRSECGLKQCPNVMVVDGGDMFVGGRYHSLVPILRESYENGRDYYHAVAVIKKGTMADVRTLQDLRSKKACFTGVGSQAGWTIPVYQLMKANVMPVADCNNHVKSTAEFFGDSCAINSLQDRNNPLGDNSNSLCEICGSDDPSIRCTSKDPFGGNLGALKCLDEQGDIAFIEHNALLEAGVDSSQYELICVNGDHMDVKDFESCSWGTSPGRAVVVSSATELADRRRIQNFLLKAAELYKNFALELENPVLHNLLFSDKIERFLKINENDQQYRAFLKVQYGPGEFTSNDALQGVRKCLVQSMRLCVTSSHEYRKCERMKTALNARILRPKMSCTLAKSHRECMRLIDKQQADITLLEAGDIYRAGYDHGLIPIMAEVYNLGTPDYYAVAVTHIRDNSSELIYLKRKNTCHTGVGQGAGWIIPMAWLITNERVRDYGCDSVRAAGEYFSKSCAPGARSPEFTVDRVYTGHNYWEYGHMCDLCHGTAAHYCDRNAMEDYYGNTGAFRCLVEGGGHVAFVKHTAVTENCDGKRKEWWARNQLTSDYQLLCRDGTRKPATEYENCYLGKVKANAVVTNPKYPEYKINAFINLLKYAQQFYGTKDADEFTFAMFYSEEPHADLIFQDATQKLIELDRNERTYDNYLDKEFQRAFTTVECRSGADKLALSMLGVVLMFKNLIVTW